MLQESKSYVFLKNDGGTAFKKCFVSTLFLVNCCFKSEVKQTVSDEASVTERLMNSINLLKDR